MAPALMVGTPSFFQYNEAHPHDHSLCTRYPSKGLSSPCRVLRCVSNSVRHLRLWDRYAPSHGICICVKRLTVGKKGRTTVSTQVSLFHQARRKLVSYLAIRSLRLRGSSLAAGTRPVPLAAPIVLCQHDATGENSWQATVKTQRFPVGWYFPLHLSLWWDSSQLFVVANQPLPKEYL